MQNLLNYLSTQCLYKVSVTLESKSHESIVQNGSVCLHRYVGVGKRYQRGGDNLVRVCTLLLRVGADYRRGPERRRHWVRFKRVSYITH